MNQPVTFVELNTADLERSRSFFAAVFGWEPQPFSVDDYLVAPADGAPGIDAALLTSRDGQPRTVPVIGVPSLAAAIVSVSKHGGTVVVEPFVIPGVGRGAYIVDPTGLLVGMHESDPTV